VSAEALPKGVVPPSEPGGRSGFLSDVIVELGFATPDAVEEAVREARSGSTVAQVLVEKGSISEEQLARATAERYGLAYIDLADFEVDRDAAALIRPSAAKRYRAVPVGFMGGGLLVAMTDPSDSLAVNDIAVMTKLEVQPAATTRSGLDALLGQLAAAAESDEPGGSGRPSASAAVFWQAETEGAGQTLPGERGGAPVDSAAEDQMQSELGELHRKLAGAETELVKARADLEASQADLKAAREAATGTTAQQDQLTAELASLREASDRASTEVEELRAKVTAAEAELSTEREAAAARTAELAAEREAAAARTAEIQGELAAEREAASGLVAKVEAQLAEARQDTSETDAVREQLAASSWRPR